MPFGWRVTERLPLMVKTPATENTIPVPSKANVFGAIWWLPTVCDCSVVLILNVTVPGTVRPSRPTSASVPVA